MSSSLTGLPQPHVVIVGGAYAGLSAALNILRICDGKGLQEGRRRGPGGGRGRGGRGSGSRGRGGRPGASDSERPDFKVSVPSTMPKITLLDARDGFFGAPLAHSFKDFSPKAWIPFSSVPELQRENVTILQGEALKVDPDLKTLTYLPSSSLKEEVRFSYDYLVVATGLQRTWPALPRALSKPQYLRDSDAHINNLRKSEGIVIVGGGAVGIETAAEIKSRHPSKDVTLVHSRGELLSSEALPSEFKSKVLEVLTSTGVKVILGKRMVGIRELADETAGNIQQLDLSDGTKISADVVIQTTSTATPSTSFLPKEVLDENNFVKIGPAAQFQPNSISNFSSYFAIGDIASLLGIKLAGRAINMGKIAAFNITTLLAASEKDLNIEEVEKGLMKLPPPRPTSLKLVMGETAVAFLPDRGGLVWGEEIKERVFGNDMALSRALGSLGLEHLDEGITLLCLYPDVGSRLHRVTQVLKFLQLPFPNNIRTIPTPSSLKPNQHNTAMSRRDPYSGKLPGQSSSKSSSSSRPRPEADATMYPRPQTHGSSKVHSSSSHSTRPPTQAMPSRVDKRSHIPTQVMPSRVDRSSSSSQRPKQPATVYDPPSSSKHHQGSSNQRPKQPVTTYEPPSSSKHHQGSSSHTAPASQGGGSANKSLFKSSYDVEMAAKQTQYSSLSRQEQEQQDKWAQSVIAQTGACVAGYSWIRKSQGYRCEAGSHYTTDELVAEGKGGYLICGTPTAYTKSEWVEIDGDMWYGPYYPREAAKAILEVETILTVVSTTIMTPDINPDSISPRRVDGIGQGGT
ncbi:hypothetical protein G7Y89_g3697 [Cudoniella acicularis]|uniref:FAD/NAD(P)-binding domain-containing protein n=1 Tax=Cudoniella acicularis TaxID=354080 RepID=A0A8H4RS34_9HELO|nr:hypothetical protein G7Y89_g3697 [Cudoniella acicularis]